MGTAGLLWGAVHQAPGVRCEIAIVNSGFGGTRLGRGVGGAIPRERVRKFAAGRRSVRRRRRARAPGVRWAYFLRLNIRVLIFLLSGLVLSRLFRTNLTVTVGYYGDRCAAAPRAESSPELSGQGGLGGTSTTKVGPAWATRQNIIFVVSRVLELHSPQSIDPGSSPSVVPGIMPCWRCSDELVNRILFISNFYGQDGSFSQPTVKATKLARIQGAFHGFQAKSCVSA